MSETLSSTPPEQLPEDSFDTWEREFKEQEFVGTVLSHLAQLPEAPAGRGAESRLITTATAATRDGKGNVTNSDYDFINVPDPPSFPGNEK